jgi:spermidine/putrescine transport system permease protein
LESFDDFLRSFFLGGYRPTLPVLIYGRLFSGLSPETGAITTLVLVLSILVGFGGEFLARRSNARTQAQMP